MGVGDGDPGENVIALVPVCLHTPATTMSQKFKPLDAFQLTGPNRTVLRCPETSGVRGGKVRDLYYKGYKTSQQQLTPGFLDLGPSVQGVGPQMGEGTHCAVALR